MRNESWANYIKERRKERHLTRRQLAILAKIDPSYMTLIERDGYVPKRDKVMALASVMDLGSDEMLLMAGYVPYQNSSSGIANDSSFINMKVFIPDLCDLIKVLSTLSEDEQRRAFDVMKACLTAVGFEIGN